MLVKSIACSNIVNYSTVMGDRILPFRFVLNTEASVLNPGPGQQQKFCYDIEGVGEDTSEYADLSHFLLGICEEIQQSDIAEITVVVDGVEQNVVWGENVEIKTEEKPDNPTGCIGLKFDFPLDKVDGSMSVCITMVTPFEVGPVNVCVFGGNTTATGMAICGPSCNGDEPCRSTFFQTETVCVPVKVTPIATPGTAKATCCGEPVIRPGESCPGTQTACTFLITQRLCIEIPIEFGADIETGKATVQCGSVSKEPCDCQDTEVTPETEEALRSRADLRERRFFTR